MSGRLVAVYLEELKATMRGRFAWLGAAVSLLVLGAVATVSTQDTWLDGYGIVAYGLVPLAFIPLGAGFMASARVSRFVESLFTAPVRRGQWLAAKILVLLTLAAGYYAAILPMFAVYAAHVGVPPLLRAYLLWTPALLVVSVVIGVLVGVLFIGRSLAAPAGAAMGLMLLYAAMMPLQELMVGQSNGGGRTGHLTLVSPAVLLKNGLGFALAVGFVPSAVGWTWFSVLVLTLGALLLACWIFLGAQGVETWEASRIKRFVISSALCVLAGLPCFVAETSYDRPAPRHNDAPAIRALFSRAGSALAMVPPGGLIPARCCSTILNRDDVTAMSTDVVSRRDLLLFLPVAATAVVRDLHVTVFGEAGLIIAPVRPEALDVETPSGEVRAYADDTGPLDGGGRRLTTAWTVRIPVTMTATRPWDVGGNRYPLTVSARYRIGSESDVRSFTARAAINAQVGPAIYEMAGAASVLPLLCLGAAIGRWRRTR